MNPLILPAAFLSLYATLKAVAGFSHPEGLRDSSSSLSDSGNSITGGTRDNGCRMAARS
ncbi:MAG: hypothetical protein ACKO3R_02945 [bacterium]